MAGYNNYFPQNYSNLYGLNNGLAQSYSNSPQYYSNNINWVQGEAGARSVSVAAGQKVLLMDSENNVFYVKSSDGSGMPMPLRVFEYKEITDMADSKAEEESFITKKEFEERFSKIEEMLNKKEKKNEQFSI